MNSIYIESKTLLGSQPAMEWLDNCGATWASGGKFSEKHHDEKFVYFGISVESKYNFYIIYDDSTHTPTALEFCQGVARILSIPEPTFGDEPTISKTKTFEPNIVNLPPNTEQKMLYPNHKTYRILDSLDGIPLDTRIPLSEWIPPFGADVLFIFDEIDTPFFTHINALTKSGLRFNNTFISNAWKHFGGHWMRIV